MNKHTPQEIADFFQCYVAQNKNGNWSIFYRKPSIYEKEGWWMAQNTISTYITELIDAPEDHDWTHLYEPNKPDHASEVFIHKEYVVAEGNRIQDLSKKVNTLLSHGWKLQGGVAIEHFPESDGYKEGSAVFYQAMVRGI